MIDERFELSTERISEIPQETAVPEPFRDFFVKEARFLTEAAQLLTKIASKKAGAFEPLEVLKERNRKLYEELLPENYGSCYGNPDHAAEALGEERGKALCFLYAELRAAVYFAYEGRKYDLLILLELFIRFYVAFTEEELPTAEQLTGIIKEYCYDYCEEFVRERVKEQIDPKGCFAADLIMNADLGDLRYLYSYGEYISENETGTAELLNSMTQEEVDAMAATYTGGYRRGFEAAGKDMSKKKTVNIRYCIGFERMVRSAIVQFREMGLEPVIYRAAFRSNDRWQPHLIGYYGTRANPQFDHDHRNDYALYLDENHVTRKLQALQQAFEDMKEQANTHAGPACIDVFGEEVFEPVVKASAPSPDKEQKRELVRYKSESAQITNRYIISEERSYTIIAYPLPSIGRDYREIFKETVRINELDSGRYKKIQQNIIDLLDQGEKVHIKGTNGNETDLTVMLHKLDDPKKQTNFENCTADVNIPVGEVFTSPLLKGTNGLLHVSRVYLEGLSFTDLRIWVRDGMIEDYSCANFDSEKDNRTFIEENILFNHETLPMGEFAIGTNTAAYEMGRRFNIEARLPILIAEKTGPHFAFGDTCYSWEEDVRVFNPDGKEIIAKENECSALRKEDPSKAYFSCHTDITIPYEELGYIKAITAEGKELTIIENGRFAVPGCEELNDSLIPLWQRAGNEGAAEN